MVRVSDLAVGMANIDRGGTMAVSEEHRVTALTADSGTRLDRLLAQHLPQLSRSRAKALIEAGQVSAGGATISDPSHRVKPGQTFAIIVPELRPAKPQGQVIALDIVYEDSDLIVVNKPAGMVVHPAPGNPDRTLVNALIAHCGSSLSGIGGELRPGIVHRIDKDTSGLIVAAKNDSAHRTLSAAFAAHDIERAYQAIVWGVPTPPAGEISGSIGRHPTHRKRMAIVAGGGKPALTRYRVQRRLGAAASLVECRLATGRTHQIRVHMAAIGHPVIGDTVYGGMKPGPSIVPSGWNREAARGFGRQALHAFRLGIRHPRSLESMRWEVDLPKDMKMLIRFLEGN
jgi:23S rRNA pseudouridine1911/1915/1917 synthase